MYETTRHALTPARVALDNRGVTLKDRHGEHGHCLLLGVDLLH